MRKLFCLIAPMVGLSLMLSVRAPAQGFTTLHNLDPNYWSGEPIGLTLTNNVLYGTTGYNGNSNQSTVFAVNTDGTGFRTLYSFTGGNDGSGPEGGVILSGNTLYGTTAYGGSSNGCGTVFAVNTDGSGFRTLYRFTCGSDGYDPYPGLVLSGNTLYGIAESGGNWGRGTVFAVNTDGTGFTNLYNLTSGSPLFIHPYAGLIISGSTLYGTAKDGGDENYGMVFELNTDGTGFTVLHSFTGGSDGATPSAELMTSGSTLYGTAQDGGSAGRGTVFKLNTDGTGFTVLHNFTGRIGSGYGPSTGLSLSSNTLYGTTLNGGFNGGGTVFQVNTDGTGFATLYGAFPDEIHTPDSRLVISGNTAYGTAESNLPGVSAVFSLDLTPPSAPQLTITTCGANVVLSWPPGTAEFFLESTTDLASPAPWAIVYLLPTVVNGLNTVTNAMTGDQRFYRLSR